MTLIAAHEVQKLERHLPKPPNINRIIMLHPRHNFRRKLDTCGVEALSDLVGVLLEAHGKVKAGDLKPELLLFL